MMLCDGCGHDTKVIDSRESVGDTIRRRRECLRCKSRFTTYEVTEEMYSLFKDFKRLAEKKAEVERLASSISEVIGERITRGLAGAA